MKIITIFAMLLVTCFAVPVRADSFKHKVRDYARTHKILLVYDANSFAGPFADAASSVHCMHTSPNCFESNGALPLRPSNTRFYVSSAIFSIGLVCFGHSIWHFLPHDYGKQMLPLVGASVDAGEIRVVRQNIRTAEGLQ